jgi:hypothetical protein
LETEVNGTTNVYTFNRVHFDPFSISGAKLKTHDLWANQLTMHAINWEFIPRYADDLWDLLSWREGGEMMRIVPLIIL